MLELTAKDRMLLGMAQTCIWWGEGADFERKEVVWDHGWYTEIGKYYPVQFPGGDEEYFESQGIPEDCTKEEYDACNKEYEKLYDAWEKQYSIIWKDMADLLERLGATDIKGNPA